MTEPLIRDISDTARWVAYYRARETERPDAVFRDPYAKALAGERGERIAKAQAFRPLFGSGDEQNDWPWTTRTYLGDRFIMRAVEAGVDLVVNLAAGLDARPYRLPLPNALRWVEVDLPEILDYKTEVLAEAHAACALERVALDLSNEDARRGLFARLGRGSQNAIVISEGLLIYLMPDAVRSLARDLAAQPSFRHWVIDLCSPGLLKMLEEQTGELVAQAGAPYVFAPPEGPPFFESCGWKPAEVKSMLKAAAKLGRLPLAMRVLAMLPESKSGAQGDRPWSAVCLLEPV
jgi:methyltransferase (TIGR00027 family)